jgi:hypothetical protein
MSRKLKKTHENVFLDEMDHFLIFFDFSAKSGKNHEKWNFG